MSFKDALTDRIELPARRAFNWKVFLIVLAGTVVGLVAVLPYALQMTPATPGHAAPHMPLALLIVLQVAGNSILYGVLAAVGLFLACRIGLGLPFVEGLVRGEPVRGRFLRVLWVSIVVGILGGIAIVALDKWGFGPAMKGLTTARGTPAAIPTPSAWRGLLASFEGGITEEVLLRLFALTLLAWLGTLLRRNGPERPSLVVLWISNVIAAVLFGLGHLPATAAVGLPLTALVVTRAIVLNGLLGVAFGWLYWTRGLESAAMAHFSADIVLHVLAAL